MASLNHDCYSHKYSYRHPIRPHLGPQRIYLSVCLVLILPCTCLRHLHGHGTLVHEIWTRNSGPSLGLVPSLPRLGPKTHNASHSSCLCDTLTPSFWAVVGAIQTVYACTKLHRQAVLYYMVGCVCHCLRLYWTVKSRTALSTIQTMTVLYC